LVSLEAKNDELCFEKRALPNIEARGMIQKLTNRDILELTLS